MKRNVKKDYSSKNELWATFLLILPFIFYLPTNKYEVYWLYYVYGALFIMWFIDYKKRQ